MELFLRDNDPVRTRLITADGLILYSIATPRLPATRARTTPLTIGTIDYSCDGADEVDVRFSIDHTPPDYSVAVRSADGERSQPPEWAFTGPDNRPYKWQIFMHPFMTTRRRPIARYRSAKLGIISRSRRASLEILPAGINLIDLIVVSFAAYMKHYQQ
ncbi:hypothetical protein BD626DRAFT_540826 [Schizophyllum amplum]|uniref:DUF6593 domain-containing protein n=1 Tax=Schizophyllum amplum TaxID=97359 RepID=A0A550BWW0_9AGAR|nr:hypothetical protein BD626DRAFT_540826 [Auriculariopsis ampla]